MDIMSLLRHVDLCSGIGGFSLGFEWAELSTPILFCDTEEWCRKILAKNFPNVPIATDVKELANDPERLVPSHDILTAGYPCQPFSVAGRQKGFEDDRHIWPYILRIVAQKRPTWCVFENVYGHVALGLDQVLLDLEAEGYSTRTFIVPAAGVNAPHRRDRLWIIAHSNSDSQSDVTEHGKQRQGELGQDKELAHPDGIGRGGGDSTRRGVGERDVQSEKQGRSSVGREAERRGEPYGEDVAYTEGERARKNDGRVRSGISGTGGREDPITQKDVAYTSGKRGSSGLSGQDEGQEGFTEELNNRDYRRRGRPTKDFWSVEPDVGRVAHGIPRRVDRLKGLGNAIVPQIAMNIGLAIKEQVN
jgi:DNA (cytosine-5)-methyltransferase 1